MYNATANNDYDSYPTPEEYKRYMDKVGQLNYAYAGGKDTTGIPMRSQMPIFSNNDLNRKWIDRNESYKTQYNNNINTKGFISSNGSFKNINFSNGFKNNINTFNYLGEGSRTGRSFNNKDKMFYQRQKSVSPFSRNLTMRSTNPNGTHSPENYHQTTKSRIPSQVMG